MKMFQKDEPVAFGGLGSTVEIKLLTQVVHLYFLYNLLSTYIKIVGEKPLH